MAETTIEHTDVTFELTDEQRALRDTVSRFCAQHSPLPEVRNASSTRLGHDPAVWRALGRDLGVLALAAPDEQNDDEAGLVNQVIVAEQLGAALFCGPVLGTAALTIPALALLPDSPAAQQLLLGLADGQRTAAFAVPHVAGEFEPAAVTVTAREGFAGWTLSGRVAHVVDAAAADVLVVAAATPTGVQLLAVDQSAAGLAVHPLPTMDRTRRQADVQLRDCPGGLLTRPGEAGPVCTRAFETAAVLLAAQQLGAAQRLLDSTVEYAKTRVQFGRAIGSFQAVKHRLADMHVAVEQARSLVYQAAWCARDVDCRLAASAAKAWTSDVSYRVAAQAIQTFGGIGFTWEHHVHLYFKRAVTDAALLGSAAEHRARIADLILDAD